MLGKSGAIPYMFGELNITYSGEYYSKCILYQKLLIRYYFYGSGIYSAISHGHRVVHNLEKYNKAAQVRTAD